MVKRKSTDAGSPRGNKRRKNEGASEKDKITEKLDFSTPTELLKTLLTPTSEEEFIKTYWEKQPFYLKRNTPEHFGNLFSRSSLFSILKEQKLNFLVDLNLCKYVEGVKEMLNQDGRATVEKVEKIVKKQNATIQFHQPQRFSDTLWQMMEQLEKYFGSHVGANVYITPPNSQGLAPHHDDIEAFVLQLEGKKNWKLHKPLVELSKEYSSDLGQGEIGKPTHDVTLEPGDLLYFPRGTIHQAKTVGDGHSTHITLSTYQNNTWGDFLNIGLNNAVEIALTKDVEFRRGLPIGVISFLGTGKNLDDYVEYDEKEAGETSVKTETKTVKDFKSQLKDLLCRLVDYIDPHTVIDSMSEDFMGSRLPPFQKEKIGEIKQPTAESKIKLLHPDHIRLVVYEDEDVDSSVGDEESEEEDDDEDTEEPEEEEEKTAKKGQAKGRKDSAKSKKKSDTEEGKPWPIKGKKKSYPKRTKSEEEKDEKPAEKNEKPAEKDEKPADGDAVEDIDMTKMDEDEHEGEGSFVKILHSVQNNREYHMLGLLQEPSGIKLPLHFGKAVNFLLEKSGEDQYVALTDLPLEVEEQLYLATTLWSEKLIDVENS